MTIDPGDHIGIVIAYEYDDRPTRIEGTTLDGDDRLFKLWSLFEAVAPDEIIFERFALRAGSAQKLVGNTFITCEVIGVIKLWCQLQAIIPIELLPSSKEYCGFSSSPKDPRYLDVLMNSEEKITEHVRDAYRLYSYHKLFSKRFNKNTF